MTTIKELKIGKYIVHEGNLCRISSIALEGDNAVIQINDVFSGKEHSLTLGHEDEIEDADITRRCGHVISKKNKSIEIMDSYNFKTFEAHIDEPLFDKVTSEDKVTYIQFNDKTKIIEVRK